MFPYVTAKLEDVNLSEEKRETILTGIYLIKI